MEEGTTILSGKNDSSEYDSEEDLHEGVTNSKEFLLIWTSNWAERIIEQLQHHTSTLNLNLLFDIH